MSESEELVPVELQLTREQAAEIDRVVEKVCADMGGDASWIDAFEEALRRGLANMKAERERRTVIHFCPCCGETDHPGAIGLG